MPRVRRRVLTISALVSLLVLFGLGFVWWYTSYIVLMLPIVDGSDGVLRELLFMEDGLYSQVAFATPGEPDSASDFVRRFGITIGWEVAHGRTYYDVFLPYWLLCCATLVLPALWLRGWGGRRRLRLLAERGCCTGCGYDLRASSERCPECGMVISRTT